MKEEPTVPRNMPPVSGRVRWVRQLSQKIMDPMDIFMVFIYTILFNYKCIRVK